MKGIGQSLAEHATVEVLSSYLDDDLPQEQLRQVQAHLETCAECHHRLTGLRRVSTSLQRLERLSPPLGLEQAVARRIALEGTRTDPLDRLESWLSRPHRQPSLLMSFAVVIALMTILMFFAQGLNRSRTATIPVIFAGETQRVGAHLLQRVDGGWVERGVDPASVEKHWQKSSPEAARWLAAHPELAALSQLEGFVILKFEGQVLQLE